MKLPRVTLDEFLSFKPCWLDDEQGRRRLRYYARKLGRSADALEILTLRRIPAEDRLWAVLRAEFIPDRILHEFACRCAEDGIDNPDPRSINAIVVKRRWIAGEATDAELAAAEADADAAARAAARTATWAAAEAARAAARTATWAAARAARAARAATWAAARAARAAWAAAWAAAETATWAAAETARNAQVDMLTQMLREYVGTGKEDTQCACMRV